MTRLPVGQDKGVFDDFDSEPGPSMSHVGSAAVVDLEAVCDHYGVSDLPSPLGSSRPVGSMWLLTRDLPPIDYRLEYGDLAPLRPWVAALSSADTSISCRVSYPDNATADLRLHGLRTDEAGFIAVQRSDPETVDAVDIFLVDPDDLEAVVLEYAGLVGPGSHQRVAVSANSLGLPAVETDELYDEFGFPVYDTGEAPPAIVSPDDIVTVGVIRARSDLRSSEYRWIQVRDDGAYLYPERSDHAEPIDSATLLHYLRALA
nr:ESX secretion-associated protein EspG [Mycolicibacterium hassiacum]